jgi:hypothetical protein
LKNDAALIAICRMPPDEPKYFKKIKLEKNILRFKDPASFGLK